MFVHSCSDISIMHYTKIIVVHACVWTGGHEKSLDLELSFAMCLTTEH